MAKAARKAKILNPKQEAKSPETSAARLKALAKETKELARLVAANTSCTEALLKSLARHKDAGVRSRVTSNPKAPADVAVNLGSQFPKQLLANPAFDLYLLECPDLLEGGGTSTLRSLVNLEVCPINFLEYAAGFDDEATQLSVLTNAATPKAAVEGLKKSAHAAVREAANWHVSVHPEAPKDWKKSFKLSVGESLKTKEPNASLNALGHVIAHSLVANGLFNAETDEEIDILKFKAHPEGVVDGPSYDPIFGSIKAYNQFGTERQEGYDPFSDLGDHSFCAMHLRSATSPEHMAFLKRGIDESIERRRILSESSSGSDLSDLPVLRRAALNPATPIKMLEKLAVEESNRVREAVASNPSSPSTLIEHLVRDRDQGVYLAAANNPNLPRKILDQLLGDEREGIQEAIARNPSTPVNPIETLAKKKSDDIRQAVAENSSAPASVLIELFKEKNDKILLSLARNTSMPMATLEQLANHENENIRENVAYNTSTPVKTLKQLAKDKVKFVRSSVAENQLVPEEILTELAEDKEEDVVCEVAKNHLTSVKILNQLAGAHNNQIRGYVAENHSTSKETLVHLAKDKKEDVRSKVAKNHSTPIKILQLLSKDKNLFVRASIAQIPSMPIEILEQLSKDKNIVVRASVAKNPSMPNESLERLASDHNKGVRRGVAENPSISEEVLKHLMEDKDEWVRLGLYRNTSTSRRFWGLLLFLSTDVPDKLRKRIRAHIDAGNPLDELSTLRAEYLEKLTSATRSSVSRLLGLRLADCPVSSLAKAQRSIDWRERCAAASNFNTPPKVLKRLSEDANILVRAAALERLGNLKV